MTIQIPQLAAGEIYIGLFGHPEEGIYHSILLPGDNAGAPWQTQLDWAKSVGGDLPTRAELATCYEQHRNQFRDNVYWSNQPNFDPVFGAYAWYQSFFGGYQDRYHKSSKLRGRAVRRLPIQSFTTSEA